MVCNVFLILVEIYLNWLNLEFVKNAQITRDNQVMEDNVVRIPVVTIKNYWLMVLVRTVHMVMELLIPLKKMQVASGVIA